MNIRALIRNGAVGLLILGGCDTPFEPKGSYREKLVVYAVLTTRADTQYVRVYTTYNPRGFDALEVGAETPVRNAQVSLTTESITHRLRDTTIFRIDKSRYSTELAAYVAYPLAINQGSRYSLAVVSPLGNVSAATSVPGKGSVLLANAYVMKEPEKFNEDIYIYLTLSPLSRGFMIRWYIDFEIRSGGAWSPQRLEVPASIETSGPNKDQFIYPALTRRSSETTARQTMETFGFARPAYRLFLKGLKSKYAAFEFRFKRAVFILTQVDVNLYNYYNIVSGFQDKFSIRTDLPDYSNIQGGLGLFGAMGEDTLLVDLPEEIEIP